MKIDVKFGFKMNIEAFSTEYSIGVKLQLMLDQMSSRWYDMFMKVVVFDRFVFDENNITKKN